MAEQDDDEIPQAVAYAIGHHPAGIVVEITFARTAEKLERRELETARFGFGSILARQLANVLERESRPDRKPPQQRPPSSRH
jgi:hypothetical protein